MKIQFKIIIGLLPLFSLTTKAQEVTIKLNAGPSGILYDSSEGNGKSKMGFGLGVGYTYFLNNHWGIATGIEGQYSQNSFNLNNGLTLSSYEVDDQTSAFEYRVSPLNKEKQHFVSLVIPILVQFRTAISQNTAFYIGAGGKFLLPGKLTVKASADEIQASGYYPDMDLQIDDLPSHGFGKVSNWEDKTTTNLSPSFLLSAETGLNVKLKGNLNLYTGVYVDYGLNDLAKKTENKNLVSYALNDVSMIQANSVAGNKNIVQHSNFFAAGIELKLAFSLNKQKVTQEVETKETTETPIPVTTPQKVAEMPIAKEIPKQEAVVYTQDEIAYIKKPLGFAAVGKTDLSPELVTRLDAIAVILQKDQNTTVDITGYTCDIGSEEQNLKVGMLRAQKVANYLHGKGVETNRMHLYSKGEMAPIVPNTSEENRIANRRVSIILID